MLRKRESILELRTAMSCCEVMFMYILTYLLHFTYFFRPKFVFQAGIQVIHTVVVLLL